MQLSTEQLHVLARFSKTPEGVLLLGILRAKLAEADESLRTLTGEVLYRAQGRAVCFAEQIDDLTKASEKLNRNASAPGTRLVARTSDPFSPF